MYMNKDRTSLEPMTSHNRPQTL